MELDKETNESDYVVWDADIFWTGFAKTGPNNAKKETGKPCAKIVTGRQAVQRSR
jgi:hypothetical protein